MIAIFFLYGLSFFAMSLAVGLESRRASALPLGGQLRWLAAFGLVHSLVEWADMFRLVYPDGLINIFLVDARAILLPISAILLVRFGIGLVGEAGPLPEWLAFAPVVLLVPVGLIVAYGLIIAMTEPPLITAADVWSRYLLYLPGCLLASFGFFRQWRGLLHSGVSPARHLMLGTALAFLFNAVVAGLVVPPAPYGLAPWLNYETLLNVTGIPAQVWRMLAALAVTFLVVRALDVFEGERAQLLADLQVKHEHAQRAALQSQQEARQSAESWIDGLVNISRRIADMENVDTVLATIVGLARQLLHADTASVALWDETQTCLELKCYATGDKIETTPAMAVRSRIILAAVQNRSPYRYPEDAGPDPERWHCPVLRQDFGAVAIVPLQLEGRSVGGLWVGRLTAQSFTPAELSSLGHLADQAVIAIEHGLMAANMQSLAVIEERSRIAHEMHDGLAQVLGYLGVEMQTLEALVRQGDDAAVLAELKQARSHIGAAQADVRESILSLRTTLSGEVGLIPALQQYLDEFEVQTGIKSCLISSVEGALRLSPMAETQLVRVVQEALANVRKHAHAPHVCVRLSISDGHLSLTVADDGIGFPGLVERGHFGLQMMRERAESVGGSVVVCSQPGAGTELKLCLPLLTQ